MSVWKWILFVGLGVYVLAAVIMAVVLHRHGVPFPVLRGVLWPVVLVRLLLTGHLPTAGDAVLGYYAVTPWYIRMAAFYALAGVIVAAIHKGWEATILDMLTWPQTAWGWLASLWTPKT